MLHRDRRRVPQARGRYVLLLSIVVLMLAMAMPAGQLGGAAVPDGFTREMQLSFDLEDSYFPEVVVDAEDAIHILWLNATGLADRDNMEVRDGQLTYSKVSPYGDVLVPPKRVVPIYPDDGESFLITPPDADIDDVGVIHVTWADDHDGVFTVYYMKVDGNGQFLSLPMALTNTTGAKYPRLAIDHFGDVHLAWAQWEILGTEATYPNVYYTKLDGESGEVVVPRLAVTKTFLASNHPAIAVDNGLKAHIVFEENVNLPGYTDEIYYSIVDAAGEMVVDMQRVTVSKGASFRPDILVDQVDVPHVTWMDNYAESIMNVYYACLADLDDIDAKRISYIVGDSEAPRLVARRGTDIHIVWSQKVYIGVFENSRIWYSVVADDGTVTTEATRLTYEGLMAEAPAVAMDSHNNLILAWDDYRLPEEEEDGVWDVYYMRTVVGVDLEPVDVLEIDGSPVEDEVEYRYKVGDEVVLYAGNSTDPNPWDEVVEYNFTISHGNITESSGWTPNATFVYEFQEEGSYVIFVKVKDGFGLKNGRPKGLLVKVSERRTGGTVSVLESPEVRTTVVAGGIGITAVLGYLIGGTEIGRFKFATLLLVPLYSRIKKEKTLDNYIRGQIHGYILAKPGCHYNQIKQTLNLNNGTLAYHLRKLEREEFIKSERDGMYKRFYPVGLKVPKRQIKLSAMQKRILEVIGMSPGISQKEVANEVGISAPAVIYHIGVLAGAKLVKREKKGSRVEYRIIERSEGEDEGEAPAPTPA